MAFRIQPSGVTMYPSQTQVFRLQNEPAPVIWATSGLTLNADRTIVATSGNAAVPMAQGRSGVVKARWTFDAGMIPAAANLVKFRLTAQPASGASKALIVEVGPTSTVAKDELSNTLATISRTVAAGDVYELEKAGNVFRLFINGSTTASATYTVTASPLKYPSFASVEWGTLAGGSSAYITLPELIGDWGVYEDDTPDADWSVTNSGGTFSDSTDTVKTTFTAGTSPGIYVVSCVVGGQAIQTTTSTVTIAPLTILGVESSIVLQPGETRKFDTNYDQNGLKTTWSVVSGGGSFTNGVYTAATTPGTSVLRSVYSNQAAEITVTVPVTITSSVGIATASDDRLRVQAAVLGEAITFTTNMTGSITWSADYGTSSGSGSSFAWTAPSTSQIIARITATNGTLTKTVECPVLKAIPQDPMATIDGEQKRTVAISRAEDRSRYGRIKDRNQQSYKAWSLSYRNMSASEFDTMGAFHDEHFPLKRVIFYDKARGTTIRRVVLIDSDISYRISANCGYEYSFRIVEG